MPPSSGSYAEYRGRTYTVVATGADWVGLHCHAGAGSDEFPDAIEFREGRTGTWVQLPRATLARIWEQRVQGLWRGSEVTVWNSLPDGQIVLRSGDPAVAARLGMEGDQNMLWATLAPANEVEVTSVDTRDWRQ
nr:hypothetical protein [Propionicimonas sp.]